MLLRFLQQQARTRSIIPITILSASTARTRLISMDMDSSVKEPRPAKRSRTTETESTSGAQKPDSKIDEQRKHRGRRKRKVPTIEPFSTDDIIRREAISLLQRQNASSPVVVGEEDDDFEESPPPPIATGTEVQLIVSELSSSGDSLSVLQEPYKPWVVAVPFALPGERITARVYRHGRGLSFGDLIRVEGPNVELRDMSRVRCKYFGKCAGCQYQMLSYEEQLSFKQNVVKRAYANYSGLPTDVVPEILSTIPSPEQYGYRTKITPHFDIPPKRFRKENNNDGNRTWEIRIGFGEKGRRSVVDIEECPIATPVLNAALPSIREDVRSRFDTYKKGATLLLRDSLLDQDQGHVCITEYYKTVRERVGKHVFEFPAGSFFQNNSSILEPLTSYVRNAIHESGSEAKLKYLVDAYCGSGLFSITLWEGFLKVVGIEISKESIESARHNAVLNNIPESRCKFYVGEAERIFDINIDEGMMKMVFPAELTAVIIDPPRKGCDGVFLEQLVKFGPGKIVYVSCNVHTQARDLGMIFEMTMGGYEIESIRGFDLFPQTAHVESVAVLRRNTTTTTMQLEEVVAVSIFVLYFAVIISLLVLILWSIFAHDKGKIKLRYGVMAVVAFTHTWYWMFEYMSWSLHNFEVSSGLLSGEMVTGRIARWLVNTSLFEEAWWAVCEKTVNWWWSEQLCLFTAGFFTVFLVKEQNIRYKWAYMLLGQMVAISVAWSLALLAASTVSEELKRSRSRAQVRSSSLTATVTVPVTVSYLAILVAPYTRKEWFLPNLTTMHGLLFVPFLFRDYYGIRQVKVSSFCTFLVVVGMAMRVRTVVALLSEPSHNNINLRWLVAWDVLHSHPAQASIGWDIIYTSLVWLVWTREQLQGDPDQGHVTTLLKLMLGSVGVAAPIELSQA